MSREVVGHICVCRLIVVHHAMDVRCRQFTGRGSDLDSATCQRATPLRSDSAGALDCFGLVDMQQMIDNA